MIDKFITKFSIENVLIILIFNLYIIGLVISPILINFFAFAMLVIFLKKIKSDKFYLSDYFDLSIKFQLIFCIYIIINSYFVFGDTYLFYKSLFYFRFFLIVFVISKILEFKYKTLDFIILSFLSFSIFLGIDIFYQYITGHDFFGLKAAICTYPDGKYNPENCERFSGFFGDELIAGNFLATYGIMSVSLFINKFNHLKSYLYISFFSFLIIFWAIILSGERNAVLALIIILIFNLVFNQKYRKHLILLISSFLIIFYFLFSTIDNVRHRYFDWPISYVKSMQSSGMKKLIDTTWGGHYVTAYEIFLDNKIFGSGFKSFREVCKNEKYNLQSINQKYDLNLVENGCSTHPHNIYFEVLSELGLIGFSIFLIVLFLTIFYPFIKNFKYIIYRSEILILLSIILTFVIPFKPTGSFSSSIFSTNMWFFVGFYLYFVNQIKYKQIIEKK